MYPLQSLHTFGLTAAAQDFYTADSLTEAKQYIEQQAGRPLYILGGGSNTVFLEDYAGCVLKIAIMGRQLWQSADSYFLRVGAGENWHELVQWCLTQGYYGFENLALIPGTVGAAPIQNIGAYGVEIEQFIYEVEYLCLNTGDVKTLSRAECAFAYRDSVFKQGLAKQFVIGSVTFRLPKAWQAQTSYAELKTLQAATPQDIFNKVVEVRRAKLPDPAKLGNAGSFFKNPIITIRHYETLKQRYGQLPCYPQDALTVKVPAAWLIDTLGFKGKTVGGIHCHQNQPLVLTNDGHGKGEQLLQLAREIKQAVKDEFRIELENEVQLVGRQGLLVL